MNSRSRPTSNPLVNGSAFSARVEGDRVFVEERRRMMDEPVELTLRWPVVSVRRNYPSVVVEGPAAHRPCARPAASSSGACETDR